MNNIEPCNFSSNYTVYKKLNKLLTRFHQIYDYEVVERKTTQGQKVWVAFIAITGNIDTTTILQNINAELPKDKHIEYIIPVNTIPLLPNGEPDYNTLLTLPTLSDPWLKRYNQLGSFYLKYTTKKTIPLNTIVFKKKVASKKIQQKALLIGKELPEDKLGRETLIDALKISTQSNNKTGIVYIINMFESECVSYAELYRQAIQIANNFVVRGVVPGNKVLIQTSHPKDIVPLVWGGMLAGAIVIPMAIPAILSDENSTSRKIIFILEQLQDTIIVTDAGKADSYRKFLQSKEINGSSVYDYNALTDSLLEHNLPSIGPDSVALYLLTSGSTAAPKIVPQTHRSLLLRSRAAQLANGFTRDDMSLNWLPLDHVGGIVMFHIRDIVIGSPQIQCPTNLILQDPLRWMDLCHEYKVGITWAPNFAYQLLNVKAKEIASKQWDLSNLWFIINGGEAIVAEQTFTFLDLLRSKGLKISAMIPVWGMSETCSAVTFSKRFDETQRDASLTSVGFPLHGISIRVVDKNNTLIGIEKKGRLQIKGHYVLDCYFNNEVANTASFTDDGWFDTGDLAIIDNTGLKIVGRVKDDMIFNGVNIPAHEIEASITQVEGVIPSYTAVFALREKRDSTDRLSAVIHTDFKGDSLLKLVSSICRKISTDFGISLYHLFSLPPNKIPKTSIGKIQKEGIKKSILDGKLKATWSRETSEVYDNFELASMVYGRHWQAKKGGCLGELISSILLFIPKSNNAVALSQEFGACGVNVIEILLGEKYKKYNNNQFEIKASNKVQLLRLLVDLRSESILPEHCIFAWIQTEQVFVDENIKVGFIPLISLLQSFQELHYWPKMVAVSIQSQRVIAGDEIINPEVTMMSSVIRAVHEEMPKYRGSYVDIGVDTSVKQQAKLILKELSGRFNDKEVAWRNQQRFVSKLALLNVNDGTKRALSNGVNCIVVGGLGGIGAHLVEFLRNRYQANIIIVGRTEKHQFNENQKLTYKKLKAMPGTLHYIKTDVIDYAACFSMIEKAGEIFSANISHVFFLVGNYKPGTVSAIKLTEVLSDLESKVKGSAYLLQACESFSVPELTLFSSVTGYLSGASVAMYSAASRYQEALSEKMIEKNSTSEGIVNVRCLSWSMWDETGVSKGYKKKDISNIRGYKIFQPERGIALLDTLLSTVNHNCAIGVDCQAPLMLKDILVKTCPSLTIQSNTTMTDDEKASINDPFGNPLSSILYFEKDQSSIGRPESKIEKMSNISEKIVQIFCEKLNLDNIDHGQNFFDIGVNSILLPEIQKRIEDTFNVELDIVYLFQYPTLKTLVEFIENKLL